jgi:hypothetical protein
VHRVALLLLVPTLLACGKDLDRDALMDPASCRECHPSQFEGWESSMHAYAVEDPVFQAMNRRGQRETNGELGTFCIGCHAPVAVMLGLTEDGLNMDEVPEKFHGITCYWCHQAADVERDHNNGIVLNEDGVLRGSIRDPIDTPAHKSAYSPLHDRNDPESSKLCGSCHDVVVEAHDFRLERTFEEWTATMYNKDDLGQPLSCGSCHMPVVSGRAADVEGAPERRVHRHEMPGVDVAITDWPGRALQRSLVEEDLRSVLSPEVCVENVGIGANVAVTFENIAAGHGFPTGATQDRRAWVQVRGFVGDQEVFSSGIVPEGTAVDSVEDPQLWRIYDHIFDEDGNQTHMFWEAASRDGETLPAPATTNLLSPEYFDAHITREYFFPTALPVDRVKARVFIRPIGLDVLDDLIDSGDLDAAFRAEIPTFELGGAVIEWNVGLGTRCNPATR